MKLISTNNNQSYINPWFGLMNILDEDELMSQGLSKSGMNMWEDDKKIYVEVAVPGMKENDLDVQLENGVLTIRAVKSVKSEEKDRNTKIYSSSMKTSFYYSTTLPSSAGRGVDAKLEDGILTLSIVKSEESKPLKIEVKRS